LRRPDLRWLLRWRRPPLGASAAGAAAAGTAGTSPPFRTTRPLGFRPRWRSVFLIVDAATLRTLRERRLPPTGAEFPAVPFSVVGLAYASILFYINLQRNCLGRAGLAGLDCEFLRTRGCLCTQVITSGFQSLLPSVDMHRRNLGICGLSQE